MEDPLQSFSTLFPRTIAPKSTDNDDLEAIHNFMISLESRSPNKFLEQAKTNEDTNTEPLNSEVTHFITANSEPEAVAVKGKEIIRGQRPGLGRKKAQFTMIPNKNQPPLSSETIPDKELSDNPREFFAYFEKRAMAEKEMKRLRGETVSEGIDFNLPRPERKRRPGILGKTVTYKHMYSSSTLPLTNEKSIPSQETFEEAIPSPVSHTSQPEAVDSSVEMEKKLTGSIATSESKINTLFDELLGMKNLDGDEKASLVMDRLQIKASIMDEIPIPTFRDFRKDQMSRNALANIQNIPQNAGNKEVTKDKKATKSLSQSLASSLPPLSPLAPISAFHKHIQQSNRFNDRFSSLDPSPPRKSSSPGDFDEELNNLNSKKDFVASTSELNSLSPEMITDGNTLWNDESVKNQFSRIDESNLNVKSSDVDYGVDAGEEIVKSAENIGKEATLSDQFDANLESSSGLHTDFQTVGSDGRDENIETMCGDREPFINNDLVAEKMKSKGHETDHTRPVVAEPSYIAEAIPEQHTQFIVLQNMDKTSELQLNQNTEEIPPRNSRKRKEGYSSQSPAVDTEEPLEMPVNDQNKRQVRLRKGLKRKEAKKPLEMPLDDQTEALPPNKIHKKKEYSRRNSLAAAGTSWKEGRRTSNRIRTRPLQYWKGERLLYGRLHESLPTVIGIKYDSPDKGAEKWFNDKRNLKVKSYVSAEYEELVNQRALY